MRAALPLLACLAATPAAAQDVIALQKMTMQLSNPAGVEAQMGAWAACVMGNGDKDVTTAYFAPRGWEVFSDPEMGMAEISHPTSQIYISLYMDGAICSVAHTNQPSADATLLLENFLEVAGIPATPTEIEGCAGWDRGDGMSIGLTSGGQDPVCVGTTDNDVRFTFPVRN
ncbi:hypothetical protein [Vannielia sp. SX4]|uniref:hypothetical protein n=1 Tax=Vannielia sp. SX4 TaxID=3463852 RepID=UPI004057E135